jgi:hypothetical protein
MTPSMVHRMLKMCGIKAGTPHWERCGTDNGTDTANSTRLMMRIEK